MIKTIIDTNLSLGEFLIFLGTLYLEFNFCSDCSKQVYIFNYICLGPPSLLGKKKLHFTLAWGGGGGGWKSGSP